MLRKKLFGDIPMILVALYSISPIFIHYLLESTVLSFFTISNFPKVDKRLLSVYYVPDPLLGTLNPLYFVLIITTIFHVRHYADKQSRAALSNTVANSNGWLLN